MSEQRVEPPGPPRRLALEGQPNFRDLGGYAAADGRRVRWRRLYRSGRLSDLTDADVEAVDALGLVLVCDLRAPVEIEGRPDRLPPGVRTVHVPVHDVSAGPRTVVERLLAGGGEGIGPEMLERGNRSFAREHAGPFATVVRHVAAAEGPVLFHCTAGKDRAGFAAATLLWALGVPTETVLADYLLSNDCLAGRHDAFLAELAPRLDDPEPLRALLDVRPGYLGAAVEAITEDHGSVDAWLRDHLGVDDATRDRLRETLLG